MDPRRTPLVEALVRHASLETSRDSSRGASASPRGSASPSSVRSSGPRLSEMIASSPAILEMDSESFASLLREGMADPATAAAVEVLASPRASRNFSPMAADGDRSAFGAGDEDQLILNSYSDSDKESSDDEAARATVVRLPSPPPRTEGARVASTALASPAGASSAAAHNVEQNGTSGHTPATAVNGALPEVNGTGAGNNARPHEATDGTVGGALGDIDEAERLMRLSDQRAAEQRAAERAAKRDSRTLTNRPMRALTDAEDHLRNSEAPRAKLIDAAFMDLYTHGASARSLVLAPNDDDDDSDDSEESSDDGVFPDPVPLPALVPQPAPHAGVVSPARANAVITVSGAAETIVPVESRLSELNALQVDVGLRGRARGQSEVVRPWGDASSEAAVVRPFKEQLADWARRTSPPPPKGPRPATWRRTLSCGALASALPTPLSPIGPMSPHAAMSPATRTAAETLLAPSVSFQAATPLGQAGQPVFVDAPTAPAQSTSVITKDDANKPAAVPAAAEQTRAPEVVEQATSQRVAVPADTATVATSGDAAAGRPTPVRREVSQAQPIAPPADVRQRSATEVPRITAAPEPEGRGRTMSTAEVARARVMSMLDEIPDVEEMLAELDFSVTAPAPGWARPETSSAAQTAVSPGAQAAKGEAVLASRGENSTAGAGDVTTVCDAGTEAGATSTQNDPVAQQPDQPDHNHNHKHHHHRHHHVHDPDADADADLEDHPDDADVHVPHHHHHHPSSESASETHEYYLVTDSEADDGGALSPLSPKSPAARSVQQSVLRGVEDALPPMAVEQRAPGAVADASARNAVSDAASSAAAASNGGTGPASTPRPAASTEMPVLPLEIPPDDGAMFKQGPASTHEPSSAPAPAPASPSPGRARFSPPRARAPSIAELAASFSTIPAPVSPQRAARTTDAPAPKKSTPGPVGRAERASTVSSPTPGPRSAAPAPSSPLSSPLARSSSEATSPTSAPSWPAATRVIASNKIAARAAMFQGPAHVQGPVKIARPAVATSPQASSPRGAFASSTGAQVAQARFTPSSPARAAASPPRSAVGAAPGPRSPTKASQPTRTGSGAASPRATMDASQAAPRTPRADETPVGTLSGASEPDSAPAAASEPSPTRVGAAAVPESPEASEPASAPPPAAAPGPDAAPATLTGGSPSPTASGPRSDPIVLSVKDKVRMFAAASAAAPVVPGPRRKLAPRG